MSKSNVVELNRPAGAGSNDPLMELLRNGARQLIHEAVEAELQEFLDQFSGQSTENGFPNPQIEIAKKQKALAV